MAIVQTVHLQGFEPGDPSFSSSQYAHPHQIRVIEGGSAAFADEVPYGTLAQRTAPPARQGTRVMRALIKSGDQPPFLSTLRAEIQYPNVDVPSGGVITWDGFSVFYPEITEQHDSTRDGSSGAFRIGPQWHEAQGSPTFRLDTSTRLDGVVRLTRKINGSAEAGRYNIAPLDDLRGKWVDYVATAKWTRSADGWFKLWASIDGGPWTKITPASLDSGIKTQDQNGTVTYWKHGIYGSMGGMLYFDWAKRIVVDDDGDYFADVQTPGTPPSGGGETPDPLVRDPDPLNISVIQRGGNATDVADDSWTLPSIELTDQQSLVVGGMARVPAGATVTGMTWNGQAMSVRQHEVTDQTPGALMFVGELHLGADAGGVGDVVVTTSANFETLAMAAVEVNGIGASVASIFDGGVGADVDSGELDTPAIPAFLYSIVGVGGTISDATPELGGVMSRTGQRVGDTAEINNNATINEGYGSQEASSARSVIARLPSTTRIWGAGFVVFPLQSSEYDEAYKRYASIHWAVPLT